jgi:hypothetical protein
MDTPLHQLRSGISFLSGAFSERIFRSDHKALRKKCRRAAKKAIMCALNVRDAFQSQMSVLLTSDGNNPPHGFDYDFLRVNLPKPL